MFHHTDTIFTGAIGSSAPIAAVTLSFDPALDLELRIISLVIGIFVGLVSLGKLIYDIWSNHKKKSEK